MSIIQDKASVDLNTSKVAVMSDIHSNYYAFKACYEDAVRCGVNGFIFLGDYVSDLADPEKTLDLVYDIQSKYPTICLRGNREGYMLERKCGIQTFEYGSRSGSLLFTYNHLRQIDFDFFNYLKISDTIEICGRKIEIAHATPDNDRYYFDSTDYHSKGIFSKMRCNFLLVGHSHKQYILKSSDKTIINPGSVGIPQDGTSESKYAILDFTDNTLNCTFRKIPYDIDKVINSQFESGLVSCAKYWAIGILYDIITGKEYVLQLLKRVQESNDLSNENIWHSAATMLDMKFTKEEILELYKNFKQDNKK